MKMKQVREWILCWLLIAGIVVICVSPIVWGLLKLVAIVKFIAS